MSEEEGLIWASDNEGIEAYLLVNFKSQLQITGFEYLNRESIYASTK